MRLLVCGGRAFRDVVLIRADLDAALAADPDLIIVCGYNPHDHRYQGADQIAYEWARSRRAPIECFMANWDAYGLAAGPMRNEEMIRRGRPTKGLVYPTAGAENKGTNDMMRRMRKAGVPFELRS